MYLFVPAVTFFLNLALLLVECVEVLAGLVDSSVSGQTHGLPYKMRSLASLRILMAVIDVFNKFSPFCWVLMDGLIPGGAGGATRS